MQVIGYLFTHRFDWFLYQTWYKSIRSETHLEKALESQGLFQSPEVDPEILWNSLFSVTNIFGTIIYIQTVWSHRSIKVNRQLESSNPYFFCIFHFQLQNCLSNIMILYWSLMVNLCLLYLWGGMVIKSIIFL